MRIFYTFPTPNRKPKINNDPSKRRRWMLSKPTLLGVSIFFAPRCISRDVIKPNTPTATNTLSYVQLYLDGNYFFPRLATSESGPSASIRFSTLLANHLKCREGSFLPISQLVSHPRRQHSYPWRTTSIAKV